MLEDRERYLHVRANMCLWLQIIKILTAERKLDQKRMQGKCSALVRKFKEETWMFTDGNAL